MKTLMFLSRLLLSHHSPRVLREMEQPNEMHRTVMRAFGPARGESGARNEFGVLFRVDASPHSQKVTLYVQSEAEPDWQPLEDLRGYLLRTTDDVPNPATRRMDSLIESVSDSRVYSFVLRANPTKRRHDNGKRVGLYNADELTEWLLRKGREGGFDATHLEIASEGVLRGLRFDGEKRYRLRHNSVYFKGILMVSDEKAFRHTIVSGIGSGKAYGFGLLSLAPA